MPKYGLAANGAPEDFAKKAIDVIKKNLPKVKAKKKSGSSKEPKVSIPDVPERIIISIMQGLVGLANKKLKENKVLPMGGPTHQGGYVGYFDYLSWKMLFNKEMIKKYNLYKPLDKAVVIEMVYHESRHAEQRYRVGYREKQKKNDKDTSEKYQDQETVGKWELTMEGKTWKLAEEKAIHWRSVYVGEPTTDSKKKAINAYKGYQELPTEADAFRVGAWAGLAALGIDKKYVEDWLSLREAAFLDHESNFVAAVNAMKEEKTPLGKFAGGLWSKHTKS